jgi:hypothetical protein
MTARPLVHAALAFFALAAPALAAPQAQTWSDNFNRPNGPLGGDWTMQNGAFLISNNTAYSTGGDHHWALHNSASANYANQRVSVDFLPRVQGPPLFYVGLALGALPSWESVFIKVQDNNGDSLYDRVFFWGGINAGASWASPSNFNLAVPTASGRMTCYFTNNGDVANLDIDRNFDGVVDEHFQLAGILGANLNLGTGVGLVSFGSPAMDNFVAEDTSGPVIASFCTSSTTSSGCTPVMAASGAPSASATSGFQISCASVEGAKSGLIFYSVAGEFPQPWAPGSTSFLCVKTPTQRTPSQSTGGATGQCNGALNVDFLAFMAANPTAIGQPLASGQTFYSQAWFRDPPAPKTTNLSNGLRFTLTP